MKYYKKENTIIELAEHEQIPDGFVEATEKEFVRFVEKVIAIDELVFELKRTDYKAIKFAEGLISNEEYAPIRAERESLRQQIRTLKGE